MKCFVIWAVTEYENYYDTSISLINSYFNILKSYVLLLQPEMMKSTVQPKRKQEQVFAKTSLSYDLVVGFGSV